MVSEGSVMTQSTSKEPPDCTLSPKILSGQMSSMIEVFILREVEQLVKVANEIGCTIQGEQGCERVPYTVVAKNIRSTH